MELDEL